MNDTPTLESLVAEVAPQVRDALAAKFTERISASMGWTLEQEVTKATALYIEQHVLPEVLKRLEAQRDVMVTAICESVAVACNQLRDKLIGMAVEKLGRSWTVDKIAKELFGA